MFELGRDAGGVALHDDVSEGLQALRDFQRGVGLLLGDGDAESKGARAGGEGGAEVFQSEFRKRDLAAGDGFAEGEAAGPFEGLLQGDGPGRAFAEDITGGVLDAFGAEGGGKLGVGEGLGGALLALGGGDFGAVEGEFGIAVEHLGDEGIEGKRGGGRDGVGAVGGGIGGVDGGHQQDGQKEQAQGFHSFSVHKFQFRNGSRTRA